LGNLPPPLSRLKVETQHASFSEWYGVARFDHPSPASPELLHQFFPRVQTSYNPSIIPSTKGETLAEIHDRTAYALAKIISDVDKQWIESGHGPRAILLVTHAATNIAAGRALTGDEDRDVRTGTCSLGVYKRKTKTAPSPALPPPSGDKGIPLIDWRGGNGVAGGWDMVVNGDCSFLKNGEERNWFFQGEEAWDFPLKEGAVSNAGIGGGGGNIIPATELGGPGTFPDEAVATEAMVAKDSAKI